MSQEEQSDLAVAMRELAKFRQRVTAIENTNRELQERVDQLEYSMDKLVTDLPTQTRSKREKLAAILEYGLKNGTKTPKGVTVTKDAAAGAASCSPRHALNLFNDLDEQFEWVFKRTNGGTAQLAIDLSIDEDVPARIADAFPEVSVE